MRVNLSTILSFSMMAVLGALPAHAQTGGVSDGGGNAVVCFKSPEEAERVRTNHVVFDDLIDEITSVEAYDLYVARRLGTSGSPSAEIVPSRSGMPFQDYAELIAERFQSHFPKLSMVIRHGARKLTDIRMTGALHYFDDTHRIEEVGDSHCVVTVMAVQSDVSAGQTDNDPVTTLYLDRRLFNHPKHSGLSKGALFLHESLYYVARNWLKQLNSKSTRDLLSTAIQRRGVTTMKIREIYSRTGFVNLDVRLPDTSHHSPYYAPYDIPEYDILEREVSSKLMERVRTLLRAPGLILNPDANLEQMNQLLKDLYDGYRSGDGKEKAAPPCDQMAWDFYHDSSEGNLPVADSPLSKELSCLKTAKRAIAYKYFFGNLQPSEVASFQGFERKFAADIFGAIPQVQKALRQYLNDEVLPRLNQVAVAPEIALALKNSASDVEQIIEKQISALAVPSQYDTKNLTDFEASVIDSLTSNPNRDVRLVLGIASQVSLDFDVDAKGIIADVF